MPKAPADSVPALLMPPVKDGPLIAMSVATAVSLLVLPIRMPWLVAKILPVSTIEPLIVLPVTKMPVAAAVIVPASYADIAGEARNVSDNNAAAAA